MGAETTVGSVKQREEAVILPAQWGGNQLRDGPHLAEQDGIRLEGVNLNLFGGGGGGTKLGWWNEKIGDWINELGT